MTRQRFHHTARIAALRDCREILIAYACVFGVVVAAFLTIITVSVFSVSGTFA